MDKRKDRWSITWEEWVSGGRVKIEMGTRELTKRMPPHL